MVPVTEEVQQDLALSFWQAYQAELESELGRPEEHPQPLVEASPSAFPVVALGTY